MKPVSFRSLYKIYSVNTDTQLQKDGLAKLQEHCKANDIFLKTKNLPIATHGRLFNNENMVTNITTISAYNHQDHDIDMICCNHKINHEKVNQKGTFTRYYVKKPSSNKLGLIKTLLFL